MIVQGAGDELAFEPCFDPSCENRQPGTEHAHLVKIDKVFGTTTELEELWHRRVAELPDGQVEGELTQE
jgi:hypothetical protein